MPVDIDDRWVDVDFVKEATLADRKMGDLARPTAADQQFGAPRLKDRVATIERSKWPELAEAMEANGGGCDAFVTYICDQDGEPSCTSNATIKSHEIIQAQQYGLDKVVPLSPISLYMRVGSRNSGSSVDANLRELANRGALPQNTTANKARFPHTMPHNGYGTKYPSGWENTAGMFRALEWFEIRDEEEFVTASFLGWPVVYGRQGHAICSVRPVLSSRGVLVFKYANSWHESWGDKGYGYDSFSQIRMGAGWAFALRAIVASKAFTG